MTQGARGPRFDGCVPVTRTPGGAPGKRQIDWVDENTDFEDIINTGSSVFFCNDLPRGLGEGYRNSHWPRDLVQEMRKRNSWPYRSTIVWPVRASASDDESDGRWDVAGFVCADSVSANVLDQDLDVAPGETFACALYLGLSAYEVRQAAEHSSDDADSQQAAEARGSQ